EQARAIAEWIYTGREEVPNGHKVDFPGPGWLRQPETHSDREWILEIAQQYRALTRAQGGSGDASGNTQPQPARLESR
ncbi:hypothetical protein ABQF26_14745, partial [Mycolicibacterium elephantis]